MCSKILSNPNHSVTVIVVGVLYTQLLPVVSRGAGMEWERAEAVGFTLIPYEAFLFSALLLNSQHFWQLWNTAGFLADVPPRCIFSSSSGKMVLLHQFSQ